LTTQETRSAKSSDAFHEKLFPIKCTKRCTKYNCI